MLQIEHARTLNVILGDMNLPKIDWTYLTSPEDVIHWQILSYVIVAGLIQFVNYCTHGHSMFDLVLSDNDQIINQSNCV